MKTKDKSIYTFLDIGTSKISCLMIRIPPTGVPEVIGHSSVQSKGIQRGTVWDVEAAKMSVDAALRAAEKSAKRTIREVFVNISSPQLKSERLYDEMDIPGGQEITTDHVHQLVQSILNNQVPPEEEILHAIPVSYVVDKTEARSDPRGINARTLGVYVYVITIPETQTMNLLKVLDWCHVTVAAKVATPYASALAVLTQDEMELGATVVDFGAGATNYATIVSGGLMRLGLIPFGGEDITKELAHRFNTDLKNAERIKTLSGGVISAPKYTREPVIMDVLGDDTGNHTQIMRSELVGAITPQVEDILSKLNDDLNNDALLGTCAKHYVLTGGGSKFDGLQERATAILDGSVRIGKIKQIKNLPNEYDSCTFTVCVGLLVYAQMRLHNEVLDSFHEKPALVGWIGKVKEWLKQNL